MYFAGSGEKVCVEGRLHGLFNPDAELTVNGTSTDLDYNQVVKGTAKGQAYEGSRADEDIDLHRMIEISEIGRPDLRLNLV